MAYSQVYSTGYTKTKVKFTTHLYYETSETEQKYTIKMYGTMYISSGQSPNFSAGCNLYINSAEKYSHTGVATKGYSGKHIAIMKSSSAPYVYTIDKTASTQSVKVQFRTGKPSEPTYVTVTKTFTIPALGKPSFANNKITVLTEVDEDIKNVAVDFTVVPAWSGDKTTVTITTEQQVFENNVRIYKPFTVPQDKITIDNNRYYAKIENIKPEATINVTLKSSKNTSLSKSVVVPKQTVIPKLTSISVKRDDNEDSLINIDCNLVNCKLSDTPKLKIECSKQLYLLNDEPTPVYTGGYTLDEFGSAKILETLKGHDNGASIITLTLITYAEDQVYTFNIPNKFYTMDFGAKGKSIAMGKMAEDVVTEHPEGLFECNMDAHFLNSVTFEKFPGVPSAFYRAETTTARSLGAQEWDWPVGFNFGSGYPTHNITNENYFSKDTNGFKVLKSGTYLCLLSNYCMGQANHYYKGVFYNYTTNTIFGDVGFARTSDSNATFTASAIQHVNAGEIITIRFQTWTASTWRPSNINFNMILLQEDEVQIGGDNPSDSGGTSGSAVIAGAVMMGDYVVEQGVQDDWVYRKWNSGIAEAWKSFTLTGYTWKAWGQTYETSTGVTATFPTGVFAVRPEVSATSYSATGATGVYTETWKYGENGNNSINLYAVRNSSSSNTEDIIFAVSLKGKWKNIPNKVTSSALPAMNDYVLEQGTIGIWTYRKWASGLAECWGITNNQSMNFSESYGGEYYVNHEDDLPNNLFISPPIGTASRWNTTGDMGLVSISIRECTTSKIHSYIWCPHSGAHNVMISYSVQGKWKEIEPFSGVVSGQDSDSTLINDTIVLQGTSGIWTYRKWASGIAECWGRYDLTVTGGSVWVSPIYVSKEDVKSIQYPFSFKEPPTENVTICSGTNACWVYKESQEEGKTSGCNATDKTAEYRAIKVNAFSTTPQTITFSFDVKGRWK